MKIGDNIREIREKEKGLKKEEVADALGISTKAYSNIENNIADVSITRLYELSAILGVAPEYILSYQNKATYTNHFNNYEGNKGVNIMYQGCTPEQIKNLETKLQDSGNKVKHLKGALGGSDN